jgi:cytochrome c peroxidase
MRRPFLVAFVSLVTFAAFATETEVAFTPDEAQRILTFGPWPPPFARDPSNRVSGDPAAIDLGRRLFADAPLSPNGYIACVTCHQTDRAWTDGISRAHAMGPLERNTPSVANAWLNRWFGWGGAADSLWAASLRPLLDANEIGTTPQRVVDRFRLNDDLACRYRRVFGRAPDHADEVLLVNIAKAIAAFQETLTTGRTLFDEFRDALARGDRRAMAAYPAAAQRGLKIFVGRGNCFFCHSGPAFTNGEFHDAGVPFFIARGKADPGRYEGIRALHSSRFNLLGPHNDDPARSTTTKTRHVEVAPRHWGEFKTPSLRNVAVTAPYMHNGSIATLRDVVRHYSDLNEERLHADGERILRRLRLSERETDDLVAFLESLTDRDGAQRALGPLDPAPCA